MPDLGYSRLDDETRAVHARNVGEMADRVFVAECRRLRVAQRVAIVAPLAVLAAAGASGARRGGRTRDFR